MTMLPTPNPAAPGDAVPTKMTDAEIVQILEDYRIEAESARKNGISARDEKWEENHNLYWNRYDHSTKANWQAKESMPEVPVFVDRFSSSVVSLMNSTPKGFYTVVDDTDTEGDLARAIERILDVWLARAGRTSAGQPMAFSGVFEEQIKLGALMMCSSIVTWKDDVPGGRVAVDTEDPRNVWLDHTGRGLYRIRRTEIDRHDLVKLAKMADSKGRSIYNLETIMGLVSTLNEEIAQDREALTGNSQEVISNRKPVVLHEYLATILDNDGTLKADRGLSIVANNKFLIRGPEKNPFWHGTDWLVTAPLVPVPFSPYGRSYMEDMGSVARTFNNLTNLILDAVQTSALNAFAVDPSALLNPQQLQEGLHPNMLVDVTPGTPLDQVIQSIQLGNLDQGAVTIWQAMKNELTEVAGQSEVGLGGFAPNSRTSATEIVESKQGSQSLVLSVAKNIEDRLLAPQLDLMWKTGMQHVSRKNKAMEQAAGPEMWRILHSKRRELVERPVTFSARGLSTMLHKSQKLRALMNVLQIMGSNEILMQEFLRVADPKKLALLILDLLDLDVDKLSLSDRERRIREITDQVSAGAGPGPGQQGQAPGGAANIAQGAAQALGVQ